MRFPLRSPFADLTIAVFPALFQALQLHGTQTASQQLSSTHTSDGEGRDLKTNAKPSKVISEAFATIPLQVTRSLQLQKCGMTLEARATIKLRGLDV